MGETTTNARLMMVDGYTVGTVEIPLHNYLQLLERIKEIEAERDYLLDMIFDRPLFMREDDTIACNITYAERDELKEKYPARFQKAYEEAKRKDDWLRGKAEEARKTEVEELPL